MSKLNRENISEIIQYLPKKRYIQQMMLVSKKCQESMNYIDIAPFFLYEQDYEWYFKHFKARQFIAKDKIVKYEHLIGMERIRISLTLYSVHYHWNDEQIISLLPKFYNLKVFVESKVFSIIKNHFNTLHQLKSLEGDIDLILKLFMSASNNSDTINYPQQIIISQYNGKIISSYDATFIGKVLTLLKHCKKIFQYI